MIQRMISQFSEHMEFVPDAKVNAAVGIRCIQKNDCSQSFDVQKEKIKTREKYENEFPCHTYVFHLPTQWNILLLHSH